jgi:hypothetical protein
MRSFATVIGTCTLLATVSSGERRMEHALSDVRVDLLKAAAAADPDFPDGRELKLTRFAYLGRVHARDRVLYVVDMRSVITGMPAPRGLNYVLFFDEDRTWLGKERYTSAQPLWCEGSTVFLYGQESNGEVEGNAWDVADGFSERRLTRIPAYGSWMPDGNDPEPQPKVSAQDKVGR